MKRTLVPFAAVVAPDIYVEKAFAYIFYPSIGSGIVAALVWRPRSSPR